MSRFQRKSKLFSSNPDYCVSLLAELQEDEHSKDTILHSDGRDIAVHSAILCNCSQLLCDLLASNNGEPKALILPGYSSVLCDFVSLMYTGLAPGLSEQYSQLLTSLCKILDVECSVIDKQSEDHINVDNKGQKHLTIEAKMFDNASKEHFVLRMPMSRVIHSQKFLKKPHIFSGFQGRAQDEYNKSPIGPYEGNFDQDPGVPITAQLPHSKLNFEQYTNFIHSDDIQCKLFEIKKNVESVDDLERMKLLKCVKDANDIFVEPKDDDNTFYTCQKNICVIPCPCKTCTTAENQCTYHTIKHIDLFNEAEDSFSVRSTEHGCSSRYFFYRSYILKYPGIPKGCHKCRKDLLNHKSYHLKFHWTCKFCKFYQYKLYPKSVKELFKREAQEQAWYKSVCPYCDTKFSAPYQRRKHVELEHEDDNKLKCDECPKLFQCKQSLQYHKLAKHKKNPVLSFNCNLCTRSFLAKVTLDNHIKYKHSDIRMFECTKCNSKFKQKKHLNEHTLNIHNINPRKEDYWQDREKKTFKCKACEAYFKRKTDLNIHIKVHHNDQDSFNCDECSKKFKYEKTLKQHKLEKHGPKERNFECPTCGKMFTAKRNMRRHQLAHVLNPS